MMPPMSAGVVLVGALAMAVLVEPTGDTAGGWDQRNPHLYVSLTFLPSSPV